VEIIHPYVPTEKQAIAHAAKEMYKFFGGSMGGGKSRWLGEEAFILSMLYPGNQGVIGRDSLKYLKYTTMEVFFSEVLPMGGEEWQALVANWNKTDHILDFKNGSSIIWMGFDMSRKDIEKKLKSLNLGWFGLEEATSLDEDIFHMMKTRLRRMPGGVDIPRYGLLTGNPEPGWVKELFIDQKLPNHVFIEALPSDNPHLPPNYKDQFENMPEGWKERYLEGDWSKLSGAVWTEFNESEHFITPFKIPSDWPRVRVVDHGQKDPTCCLWFAESFEGKFFCYREYYVKGEVASEHASKIVELSEGESYRKTLCDPSMFKKDREFTPDKFSKPIPSSVSDDYRKAGLTLMASDNDITGGINRVNELFKSGALYVFNNCLNLRRELRRGRWDPDAIPERPVKGNDHATDCLRYFALSAAKVPLRKLPPLKETGTFEGAKKLALEAQKQRKADKYGALRKLFAGQRRLAYFK